MINFWSCLFYFAVPEKVIWNNIYKIRIAITGCIEDTSTLC